MIPLNHNYLNFIRKFQVIFWEKVSLYFKWIAYIFEILKLAALIKTAIQVPKCPFAQCYSKIRAIPQNGWKFVKTDIKQSKRADREMKDEEHPNTYSTEEVICKLSKISRLCKRSRKLRSTALVTHKTWGYVARLSIFATWFGWYYSFHFFLST